MDKYNLSELERKNFSEAVNKIYLLTDYNNQQYPDYYNWYFNKSIPRIFDGTGEIIFYLDTFDIVGLTILKRDEYEKKLCTFMINEDYRKRGYSKELLEDAFDFLGTSKPIITIPKFRLDEFSKIIDAYDWIESGSIDNYKSDEIVFNEKVLKRI
jgi:GNAT superfamily N-acetyltransferase